MRIMGLDFGSKTVGVAVSDPLLITAQGLEIIRRKEENKLRQTLARIEELITEYEVEEIVLGLPKNMNGTEGPSCDMAKEFAAEVEKAVDTPIVFWDERLTSRIAENAMIEADLSRKKRKQKVDSLAAILILQNYLDYLKSGKGC